MRGDALDLPPEAKLAVDEGNVVELVEGERDGEDSVSGEEMGKVGADASGVLAGVGWGGAGRTWCWMGQGREFGVGWGCWSELGTGCIGDEVETGRRLFDGSQGGRAVSRRVWHGGRGNPQSEPQSGRHSTPECSPTKYSNA